MSRTYRFRTRNDKPDRYITTYHPTGLYNFLKLYCGVQDSEREDEINKSMRDGKFSINAPKWYRKRINKKKKVFDKKQLKKASLHESYDDMTLNPWKNDAGYTYF